MIGDLILLKILETMKFLKDSRIIIAITILANVIIIEVGKSVRINQFKKIDESKIESMSKYEEKSKSDYLKPLNDKFDNKNEY